MSIDKDSAIGHLGAHLEWKYIWYRIISLYWADDNFKRLVDGGELTPDQVRNLIRGLLGYEINQDVELTFAKVGSEHEAAIKSGYQALKTEIDRGSSNISTHMNNSDREKPAEAVKAANPFAKMPPMKVTLPLPPPPPAEIDKGVALAVYARSGKGYPFTSA